MEKYAKKEGDRFLFFPYFSLNVGKGCGGVLGRTKFLQTFLGVFFGFFFWGGGGGGRWEAEESRIQDITAKALPPTSAPTHPKIRCASDWNLWQGGKR